MLVNPFNNLIGESTKVRQKNLKLHGWQAVELRPEPIAFDVKAGVLSPTPP